tara:strand:+ start:1479 stop:1670 length:192 start_codon:yes stop_codon:yes gene_type:complete
MGKRTRVIKEVIREVAGYAAYEKRMMELLRNKLDKRALRYAKRRVSAGIINFMTTVEIESDVF